MGSTSGSKTRSHSGFCLRAARPSDAAAAAAVLRASITLLCVADHGNEPEVLARWLANKTEQDVRMWMEASACFLVAERHGRILGVGAALDSGKITLNYVLPDARFRGVSKAMLRGLEESLRAMGCACSELYSTITARRFYLAAGYVDAGEPQSWHGLTAFPMIKTFQFEVAR